MASILVIDDDREFVEAVERLLTAKGYTVCTACDGESGYAHALANTPDCILLDVMMRHDTEGLDIARRLAENPSTRSIPVITITGIRIARELTGTLAPDAQWLPVRAVLEKPVTPDTLLTAIREVLA